jgi:hypothetical protein
MALTRDIFGGTWVRHTRYEIRGGVICPAPDAQLVAYDPWHEYADARRKKAAPLYDGLLRLSQKIRTGLRLRLRAEDAPELLGLCAQFGLLGILPHRAASVRLWPRWGTARPAIRIAPSQAHHVGSTTAKPEPDERELADVLRQLGLQRDRVSFTMQPVADKLQFYVMSDEDGTAIAEIDFPSGVASAERPLVPQIVEFARTNVGWREITHDLDADPDHGAPSAPGALLSGQHQSYVVLQQRWRLGWKTEPLDLTWGLFFPAVPPRDWLTERYPLPLSDAFWLAYGEPVDEFLSAVDAFREAAEGAKAARNTATTIDDFDPQSPWYRLHALLVPITASVMPSLVPALPRLGRSQPQSGRRLTWRTPSLLSAFALMLAQDVTTGDHIHECPVCGQLFSSITAGAAYCSTSCKATSRKRRQRSRTPAGA